MALSPGANNNMSLDANRINKELKEISKDVASGVEVQLRGSDLNRLVGYVPGPKDTPYEGGRYEIDINLDEQYPFVPPRMRFVTKVWHPNISSASGAICLDVLKDQWSPALTIKTALLSLQALLSSPQPDDPQDAVVAKQYLDDRKLFNRTARLVHDEADVTGWCTWHWTEAFAIPKNKNEIVCRIMEMGFSKEAAHRALKEAGGDENLALEKLLG